MQTTRKMTSRGTLLCVSYCVSRFSFSLCTALSLSFAGNALAEDVVGTWQTLDDILAEDSRVAQRSTSSKNRPNQMFHGEQRIFTTGKTLADRQPSAYIAENTSSTAPIWIPPEDPRLALKQLVNAENWAETLRYTAYLLQENPQNEEALFYRAVAQARLGQVPQALQTLAAVQIGDRDYIRAAEQYKKTLLRYAQKPFIGRGEGGRELKIAVLLPLSGPQKQMGHILLNTLQMAVFEDFPHISLYPYDTQEQAPTAVEQAQKALATGVDAVIGPLFSTQAEAIKPLAEQYHTPFLSLSSDRHAAGKNLHIFNYRPDAQTKLATQYALQQGAKAFAALIPATPYGYDVLEVFQKTVTEGGGQVTNIAFFNPEKADISEALNQLFEKKEAGEEAISPYDALFLPTDAAHLPLVISQMALYDVDRMTNMLTLGTAAWTEANMRRGMAYMRDGIFALPPKNTALLEGYKTTYGNLPPQMAQVAYDALTVLSQAHTRAGGLHGNLLHPSGFTTPSGPLRFHETGLPERSYPLRNITQRTYQTVVPLPTAMPTPLPTPLHPTEKQTWNWFNFGAPSGREAFPETDTYTPQPERQLPPQPWEKPEEVQPVPQKRPEKSLFQRFIPW